jgi:hypothetical protein
MEKTVFMKWLYSDDLINWRHSIFVLTPIRTKWLASYALLTVVIFALAACDSPPDNPENICEIFDDRGSWHRAAKRSHKKWGAPIALQMAILKTESSFEDDARPNRRWFLGLVPLGRPSSAYGYAQAIDGTWATYKKQTGDSGADRDDFSDAVDFVGWYVHKSHKELGLSKADFYSQYLAYHEGQSGFRRRTFEGKPNLQRKAQRVQSLANRYAAQYAACKDDLGGFFLSPF